MPKRTSSLADVFVARARQLENTRSKMERLLGGGDIELPDIEQVYVGLYLDIFTEFEAMIEDLFLGLLSGQLYSKVYSIKRRVKMHPASMARQVLFAGRPYLDWLPYRERTIPRARIFFDAGNPFTSLDSSQEDKVDNYHIIRNALAHKSESAYAKFQTIISGLTLLPEEKSPAGYLRSKPYSASAQTQYQIAFLELEYIARRLCS